MISMVHYRSLSCLEEYVSVWIWLGHNSPLMIWLPHLPRIQYFFSHSFVESKPAIVFFPCVSPVPVSNLNSQSFIFPDFQENKMKRVVRLRKFTYKPLPLCSPICSEGSAQPLSFRQTTYPSYIALQHRTAVRVYASVFFHQLSGIKKLCSTHFWILPISV